MKDLAEKLDITYQNLYAILSGKTRLTLSMAKMIATYLGMSMDDLTNAEEIGVEQILSTDAERLELDPATEAPFQNWRERRQHIVQMSSEPSHQSSGAQPSLFQNLSEREADQLLFRLLQLIQQGSVPRAFFRILAEKLKPYLADQTKENQPREE